MKILLLTTDTTHHTKFTESLAQHAEVVVVSESKSSVRPDFATASEILAPQQKAYELDRWFGGSDVQLRDICDPIEIPSVNSFNFTDFKSTFQQDFTLVFGTSILSRGTIRAIGTQIFNFHGGDPQSYRGLDSHLWCAYHADWQNLKVALHVLEATIDTGPLLTLQEVDIEYQSSLHQLRAFTTELCISMIFNLINTWPEPVASHSMQFYERGRYYSHMPAVLLDRCRHNYSRWTSQ